MARIELRNATIKVKGGGIGEEIEVHIGDGDLKYTEASQYRYDLDRGLLDTVRAGDETPMEVSLNFVWDQVKGANADITPIEALKGIGKGAEWVTSATDTCEPYAVDLEVVDDRPCGTEKARTYLFPDFRSEKRDYAWKDAAISINGKCLATEPTITVEA